jgi:hypothetical protein
MPSLAHPSDELAFAKLNSHLRRIGACTIDAPLNAIGEICGFFDPDGCWNYFRAAGYVSDRTRGAVMCSGRSQVQVRHSMAAPATCRGVRK